MSQDTPYTFEDAGDEWTSVRFPYDATVVARLKQTVPQPFRRWNRDMGAWLVDNRFKNRVERLLAGEFACEVSEGAALPARKPHRVLCVSSKAPDCVVKAAHDALVAYYAHSPSAVREVEAALATIQRERGGNL